MVSTRRQIQQQINNSNETRSSTQVENTSSTQVESTSVQVVEVSNKERVSKDTKLLRIQVQKTIAKAIARDMNEKRVQKSNHYGLVKQAYEENKKIYPWLNYHQLHY